MKFNLKEVMFADFVMINNEITKNRSSKIHGEMFKSELKELCAKYGIGSDSILIARDFDSSKAVNSGPVLFTGELHDLESIIEAVLPDLSKMRDCTEEENEIFRKAREKKHKPFTK